MDRFLPEADSTGKSRHAASRLVHALLVVAVWLAFVSLPWPARMTLDGSWQAVLVYAHARHWQFGSDLVFTWGPLGYLCSEFHLGSAGAVPKLAWEIAGKGAISAALLHLLRDLPLGRRLAFVCAWICLTDYILDVAYLVVIVAVVVLALMRRDTATWERLAGCALLAVLAQLKFTYTLVAAAGVILAAVVPLRSRQWGRAASLLGVFAGGWLLVWFLAGQGISNLVPYVRRSLEVATGYDDAMGLDETRGVFLLAVATIACCGVFVVQVLLSGGEPIQSAAPAPLQAAVWFLVWKEAIIRADDHTFSLFFFTILVALFLPAALLAKRRWHGFEGVIPLCVLGALAVDAVNARAVVRLAPEHLLANAQDLLHAGALPRRWEREYREAAGANALPKVRQAVGAAGVDVFDYYQSAALLNGLRYTPRPVFQSYTAYTPGLSGRNLRFYQSGSGPEFVLWNPDRLDGRFPSLDDSYLWQSWLGHYAIVLDEGPFTLLRRTSPLPPVPPARVTLRDQTVGLGEGIPVPQAAGRAVGLSVAAVPTGAGRLRALLYKPALVDLVTTEVDTTETHWRLLPRVAAGGFLLSPFAQTRSDLADLLHGKSRRWVKAIRFEAPAGEQAYWRHFELHFYAIPDIAVGSYSPFGAWVYEGILPEEPLEVEAGAPTEFYGVEGHRVAQLHAPGRLVMAIPGKARGFCMDYGIRPDAYTGDGHTAGVRFSVEAARPDGTRTALWQTFLDPVGVASDRGLHHQEIELPEGTAGTLTLRTAPASGDDNRWDWSYVSGLRFHPTMPSPRQ